jgi:hypothetical protein
MANLLDGHGIAARVINDFFSEYSHTGEAISPGASPTVVVPEELADAALAIVRDAEESIAEGSPSPELARLEAEAGEDGAWPACPSCGRARLAACPVCETAGTDFPEAFMPEAVLDAEEDQKGGKRLLVICPTCDEPFVPEFPARCEWCGYRFRNGYEPPPIDTSAMPAFLSGDVSLRLAMAALGIVLVMAAVLAWFYYVLRY